MSTITRAFTTRRLKSSVDLRDNDSFPHRSNTTKAAMGSIRHKISAPVELIHTTNMLSYNAPDLFPKAPSSATSSKSDSDSDTAPTTASTPPTSPDTPFPEKRSESPEPNHLSCYFSAPKHQSAAAPLAALPEAPAIPQRAPSHTKKSYEGLVRHRSASRLSEQSTRSVSTKSSFTFSRSSSSSTSTSTTSVSHTSVSHMQHKPSMASLSSLPPPAAPPVFHSKDLHKKDYSESHPFGHELAQVSELAEEYGIKDKLNPMEQEEQELLQKGLKKFSAEDYLSEVRSLTSMFFAEAARPLAAVWI